MIKIHFKQPWLDILCISLFAAVVYSFSFGAWFHGDDFVHLHQISVHQDDILNRIWSAQFYSDHHDHNYRPVTNTLFALLSLNGSAWSFRAVIVFLHLVTGWGVWSVLKELGISRTITNGVTLLFLFNPAIHTTVLWISAVGDILTTCFCVWAVYFFLRRPGRWAMWFIGVVLFYVLGMLSKELGIVLPALLFLFAWFRKTLKKDFAPVVILGCVGIAVFFVRGYLLHSLLAGPRTGYYFSYGFATCISVAKYVYSLVVPFPFHWTYRMPVLLLWVILPMALVVGFLRGSRPSFCFRVLVLAAGFTGVTLFPVINAFADWYMYLPSIGICIGLAFMFDAIHRPWCVAVLWVYLIVYLGMTCYWQRIFIKAGKGEQQILTQLSQLADDEIILAGMPRQYCSAPMLTFSPHLEYALSMFYQTSKHVQLPATTYLECFQGAAVKDAGDGKLALSLDGDALNYFDLNRARASFWREYTHVTARNKWGLPIAIVVEFPEDVPVYLWQPSNIERYSFQPMKGAQ